MSFTVRYLQTEQAHKGEIELQVINKYTKNNKTFDGQKQPTPPCPGTRQQTENKSDTKVTSKTEATKVQWETNGNNQSRPKATKRKPWETRKIAKVIVKHTDTDDTTLKKSTPKPPNAKAKKIKFRFENSLLFKLNACNTNQSSGKDNSICC